MIIWGRLLGSALGLGFGVPGVIVGFGIGYFFDKGLEKNLYPSEDIVKTEQLFFETTFKVMGHLAASDGGIEQAELRITDQLFAEFSLSPQKIQEAKDLFKQGQQPEFNLQATILTFVEEIGHQPTLKQFFFNLQLRMAYANGTVSPAQRDILSKIAQAIGFSATSFENAARQEQASYRFTNQSKDELKEAYQVLGVPLDAPMKDIKLAYRKLMSENHPDKLAAKGLPKEMMQLAKEKTQEIASAYEVIKKSRG